MATGYTFSSGHMLEKRPYHHNHSWWRTMCHPVGCPCAICWCNSQTSWQLQRGLLNLCPPAAHGNSLTFSEAATKSCRIFSKAAPVFNTFLLSSHTTDSLRPQCYLPWPMSEVTFLTWNTRKSSTAVRLEGTMNQKTWQPCIQGMVTTIKRITLLLITSHTNSQWLSQGW